MVIIVAVVIAAVAVDGEVVVKVGRRSGSSSALAVVARHSGRGKKTRRTKEEVGRQYQGMDLSLIHI